MCIPSVGQEKNSLKYVSYSSRHAEKEVLSRGEMGKGAYLLGEL